MDQDKIVGLLEDMANQNGDFRMKIKPIDVEGEEADYEKGVLLKYSKNNFYITYMQFVANSMNRSILC